MDKERNTERKFTQELDKMLAGEEPGPSSTIDEDYQTAIGFARRLIELRAEPSPAFESQLKERLLLKLSRREQETEAPVQAKRSWLWEGVRRLVPESMVLRAAAITSLVAIMTAGTLWGLGMFTQSQTPSLKPPLPPPQPPVTVEITTIRTTSPVDGEVECVRTETVEVMPAPSPGTAGPPVIYNCEETTWNFPSYHKKSNMEQQESIEYDYYRR